MAADSTALRFLGAFGVALCLVLAMLWLALEISGFADGRQRRELDAHEVTVMTESQRATLRELLGEARAGPSPTPAPLAEPPALDLGREARGVVQLEAQVDAAGRVSAVRVINASPPGIYDQRAVAEIRARRYEPDYVDGRAVPSRRLEIVDFELPAVRSD